MLSFIDENGFPFSLPVTMSAVSGQKLELTSERPLEQWPEGTARSCLLFHSYEDGLENLKEILLKGDGTAKGGQIVFTLKSFFEFGRKGGLLSALRFIIEGKKQARMYFEQKAYSQRASSQRSEKVL